MATKKPTKCRKNNVAGRARTKASTNKTHQIPASSPTSNTVGENLTAAEKTRHDILLNDENCVEILSEEQVKCRCNSTITLGKGYKYHLTPWFKHENRCAKVRAVYYGRGLDMPSKCMIADFGRKKAEEIIAARKSGELIELTSAPGVSRLGHNRGQANQDIDASNPTCGSSSTGGYNFASLSATISPPLLLAAMPIPSMHSPISKSVPLIVNDPMPAPFTAVVSNNTSDTMTCKRIEMALPRVAADHEWPLPHPEFERHSCVLDWNIAAAKARVRAQ
ncbi:hypothetical protein J3R30DRAFT_764272 [Lentinula aciculospora]|uniref:Uncharacterized protein n=1 Tax=Lentinula aciculospora TaxID=153920 RepID=A0A9W9A3J8_9AGAR|nr:hypothetical protein J3R30DRAFT_3407034 [Lentinula aciculospora]KAJ4473107.1 hypothetical protein J3R30DRAFT_764272 [Lentinula aciculospora]